MYSKKKNLWKQNKNMSSKHSFSSPPTPSTVTWPGLEKLFFNSARELSCKIQFLHSHRHVWRVFLWWVPTLDYI